MQNTNAQHLARKRVEEIFDRAFMHEAGRKAQENQRRIEVLEQRKARAGGAGLRSRKLRVDSRSADALRAWASLQCGDVDDIEPIGLGGETRLMTREEL